MTPGKQQELSESLERMIRVATRNLCVIEGVVNDVDTENVTCDVTVGDDISSVLIAGVPLEVLIGSAGCFTIFPSIGSNVLLTFRDGNQDRPQLLKVDQATLIQMNGGKNGGMLLLLPVLNALNAVQQDVNNLKSAFNTWEPVPDDGGAALKAAAGSWSAQPIEETTREEIENTDIIQ